MKAILLTAFALFLFMPAAIAADSAAQMTEVTIVSQDGAKHVFHVEAATEWATQERGLMYRAHIPADGGMLFVFPASEEKGFWMRNTFLPLDMLFVTEDGVIHKIHHMAIPEDITPIRSEGPVKYVMEINGGTAEALGLAAGDKLYNHDYIGNELAP